MKLCVQNIPFSTTEPQLRECFEQIGTVTKVTIIYDKQDSRPRGFGFVEMATDEEGNEAIEKLNGFELFGRPMRIELAREREPRQGYDNHSRNQRGNDRDNRDRGGYRR